MDTEPVICEHCNSRPATRFTDLESPHDPACEPCFDAYFFTCERCDRIALWADRQGVCVCRQTRSEPAEYADWCPNCASPSEPDCDDVGD